MKIFVGNLPSECARADVIELFEKYGSVKDCDIIKNYGFVQIDDEEDAKDAIEALNKSKFMGNDLTVEESTSRPRNTHKLYVGNLSSTASKRDLEKMFDKYGDVTSCDIIKDYAFVHMAKEREAEKAIRDLHGITFAGRKLIVDFSRSESERRGLGRFGNRGGYRDYYDNRWNDYNYGRGGYGGGYRRGGGGYYNNYRQGGYYGGGGGGRYNSYNRDRSPVRRRRRSRSRSRSRSPSGSRSRSPSRSPERRKSESHSPKQRRKRTNSRRSHSKSRSQSPDRRSSSKSD